MMKVSTNIKRSNQRKKKKYEQIKFKSSEGRTMHSFVWVSSEREQGRSTLNKVKVPYANRVPLA